MKENYKVIDKIAGEIIEHSFRKVVIDEAHERIKNYKELYNKDYYLVFINGMTYELREYSPNL